MTGFKTSKAVVLDFFEKMLLGPKWGKWVTSGPRINIFGFFSKSVH